MTSVLIILGVFSFGCFGAGDKDDEFAQGMWFLLAVIFVGLALTRVNFGWPS